MSDEIRRLSFLQMERSSMCAPLHYLEVLGSFLTTVCHDLVFYYLSLPKSGQASAFDSRDVDEYVPAPGLGPAKPVAFGRIEPFHSALSHFVASRCRLRSLPNPKPKTELTCGGMWIS